MKTLLSEHAKEQSKKRNILINRIVDTVNSPEEIVESFRGRKLYRKKYHDRLLEVVVIYEHDIIVVVTQYYLDL